jgi:hypothetical protein
LLEKLSEIETKLETINARINNLIKAIIHPQLPQNTQIALEKERKVPADFIRYKTFQYGPGPS